MYYAVIVVVTLSYYSVQLGQQLQGDDITPIAKYFLCEASGSGNGVQCDRSGFDHLSYHGLAVLIYLLLGLIPVVNLTFVINWTVAKESIKHIWMRYSKKNFITSTNIIIHAEQTSTINETRVWWNPYKGHQLMSGNKSYTHKLYILFSYIHTSLQVILLLIEDFGPTLVTCFLTSMQCAHLD